MLDIRLVNHSDEPPTALCSVPTARGSVHNCVTPCCSENRDNHCLEQASSFCPDVPLLHRVLTLVILPIVPGTH